MRRTAINIYRPRVLLVMFAAAVLAAMALVGVMADSSGAATGVTTRVSVDSSGAQGNRNSFGGSISADGRYIAFGSSASNLVADDTNGFGDAFVHDRQTGTTERVSVNSSGDQANGGHSFSSSMSADGRYIVLTSEATDLVADDTNGKPDVFVHDRDSDENGIFDEVGKVSTERVSVGVGVDGSVSESDSVSNSGSISADGRYVSFGSSATNLVTGDTNGKPDVFVRDRETGTTERVSLTNSGEQANDFGPNEPNLGSRSGSGSISADGRYVAFASVATDLVAGDDNGGDDAFVRDRQLETTKMVSVDPSGNERENTASFRIGVPSMSPDGRYVVFDTFARNLVPGDSDVDSDVFVRDRQTERTELMSVNSCGVQGDFASSDGGRISADGRYVAFTSSASNLVSDDTNRWPDVFVHDRDTTQQISECPPTPPTTTASATTSSGATYQSDTWTNEDVKVTLSAQDNEGGSGLRNIRYSATGAQSIAETIYDPDHPLLINTEGTTTISYFAIDNAGNRSQSKTFTVKIDRDAPLAPAITSPANNSYDTDGSFTVSGIAEANSTVELFEGTASQGTTTADASGQWSKSLSDVSEGTHTYTAKAKDTVGNLSGPSNALTVIVDKSPPRLDPKNSGSVEPDNGATGVSRSIKPEATFSDAMNPATLTTSTVKLYQRKSGEWRRVRDTNVSCVDDPCHTVTLDPYPSDPTRLLAANKKYKVTITTGAKNLAGLRLSSSKSWTFTTGE